MSARPETARSRPAARRVPLRHVAFVAALFASLSTHFASAEPNSPFMHFSPVAGYAFFPEHARFSIPGGVDDQFYVGGRIGFQMNTWVGLEIAAGMSPTTETFTSGTPAVTRESDLDFFHGSGDLVLTPWHGSRGGPFLLLGAGGLQMNRQGAIRDASGRGLNSRFRQWNAEGGLGWQYWLGDVVGLRFEARHLLWPQKAPIASEKDWIGTTIADAGITFAIGANPRDSDLDKVPDRRDKCPNTPLGARVDENGCPIDSDGDKVPDGIDQCDNTPAGATVDARGCPTDSDGDGVYDGLDQCADTPRAAKVDAAGCPTDSDHDGVFDGIDQCEGTPTGVTVDARGCPVDTDNDGVPDGIDKCPGTSPGLRVDQDGCPIEVTEKETELLDTGMIRLQDVRFDTGKATLKPEALPQLDIVGQVLGKWPELKIEIGGHTDSRGGTAYNQRLSEERVRSVLDYLVGKFPQLKREQYTLVGYGESKPLKPNNSAANMAQNRRVEFKVLNRDVLRREIEHRKLLKKD
jgi:outer membrane protein OmpA-like peptidoglycan-associated protein